MGLWQRLHRQEDGQVLYLTIVMLMLLTAFTLVLTNVIYLAVLKVRAQNAADALAVSVAVKKARFLNSVAETNGLLEYGGLLGGNKREKGSEYLNWELAAYAFGWVEIYSFLQRLDEYNQNIDDDINRLAVQNDLPRNRSRYGVFPHEIQLLDFSANYPPFLKGHLLIPPYVNVTFWLPPFPTLIEPGSKSLSVQTRVELNTQNLLLGGKRLGVKLPDITARGRVEIWDTVRVPYFCNHSWQVRLIPADDRVDEYIRGKMH